MGLDKKRFFTAVSVLIGTCIGAGFLGIPYVASKVGFLVALAYIIFLGLVILLVNLYLGEISLRTKEEHQIAGYARTYLGRRGFYVIEFATVFGIYAAIIAYTLGVGESLSFLFFKNSNYTTFFGILFGFFMSGLLWRGMKVLKKFEKIGVAIILFLLLAIFFIFAKNINIDNLNYFNLGNIFLPFGVVLFALLCFSAIPQIRIVLRKNENKMKKVLIAGTLISVVFYSLFTFVVVGVKGSATPQLATLALGGIFVLLGIFTMITSYLALGNALLENLMFDKRYKKKTSWFLAAIIPMGIFILIRIFGFFSFTKILSIGGVISGGLMSIAILFMIKNAKKKGNRKPEYSIPINWFIIIFLSLIFILGIVKEFL